MNSLNNKDGCLLTDEFLTDVFSVIRIIPIKRNLKFNGVISHRLVAEFVCKKFLVKKNECKLIIEELAKKGYVEIVGRKGIRVKMIV